MRRAVLFACITLSACHKKQPQTIVVLPPPAPTAPPRVTTNHPKPARRPAAAAKKRSPSPVAPPAAAAALGEYVDPAQRQALLGEIDRNLRESATRLNSVRSTLTPENVMQIESMIRQAEVARSRNMLLTSQKLAARALALTGK